MAEGDPLAKLVDDLQVLVDEMLDGMGGYAREPGELVGPQKVAPARGSAVGSAAGGDGEAAGARLYRLVWSSQCGCVLH